MRQSFWANFSTSILTILFLSSQKETHSHGRHTFKWTILFKMYLVWCFHLFSRYFSTFSEVLAGLHGFFDDMAGEVSDSDDSIMDEEMSDDDDADVDALLFFPDF